MTITVNDTIQDYFFYLKYQKTATDGTIRTYRQTLRDFCHLFGLKSTKDLTGSHITRFKNYISTRPRQRKPKQTFQASTVYSSMIRLKAYLKRLSEKGLLQNVSPLDVPLNKIILKNPTYLTKEELKLVFTELDKKIQEQPFRFQKRDYVYAAFMLRAMVHLFYATGLRSAELRNLKPTDINLNGLSGVVIGKGRKQNNFTFNKQAKEAMADFLKIKKKYYEKSPKHREYLFTS